MDFSLNAVLNCEIVTNMPDFANKSVKVLSVRKLLLRVHINADPCIYMLARVSMLTSDNFSALAITIFTRNSN